MKPIPTYILTFSLLLFASCEKKETVITGNASINEFLSEMDESKVRQVQWPDLDDNNKMEFVSGDKIYVFGFFKNASGSTGTRFLPDNNNDTGSTYTWETDITLSGKNWHRFKASDTNVGLWRDGFWHDFTAYYYPTKFSNKNQTFTMTDSGLAESELLWGETKNVFFDGSVVVTPRITFKHQLSRIRIKIIREMDDLSASIITIDKIAFTLNKTEADFNVENGQWTNYRGGSILIELFPETKDDTNGTTNGVNLENIDQLISTDIIECWVLPDVKIEDFEITMAGATEATPVVFEHHSDPSITKPTTKPGYITELQLEFGDIKTIVFTTSLVPWTKVEEESDIED